MKKVTPWLLLLALLITACQPGGDQQQTSVQTDTPIKTPPERQTGVLELTEMPPVEGPDPNYRVGVFYYPWYSNQAAGWPHWSEYGKYNAPDELATDYYPVLGPYDSHDPLMVAQHFAWMRGAGIGIAISTWWGQGTHSDRAVPVLLDQGERYGIKIAFHIEPYGGRSNVSLVDDIEYLYREYGDHSAFFRTTASSRWSPDNRPKGLFFVWLFPHPDGNSPRTTADYWTEAIDQIHALPDGGLIIANEIGPEWVDGAHVDGLYNYAALEGDPASWFSWGVGLPRDAWYVPSVAPGFVTYRLGYSTPFLPREVGKTYRRQWEEALGIGLEPAMVTITSFNEWHEGTQIEPALALAEIVSNYEYLDYEGLASEAYLEFTADWIETYENMIWPETYQAQFRFKSGSDWANLDLAAGGRFQYPEVLSSSENATYGVEDGRFIIQQDIETAEAGGEVDILIDVMLLIDDPEGNLTFEIRRGAIGWAEVEVYVLVDGQPELLGSYIWSGNQGGRESYPFEIPADEFINPGQ